MRVLKSIGAFLWRLLKAVFKSLWGFMVIFSFIVNLVLVVVVAVLALVIFNIKNDVAEPLLTGLHSSFVGLDEATIDWTIPVRDIVPVEFILPLNQDTVVVLTEAVTLTVPLNINLGPGNTLGTASATLTLPEGLELPVALNLDVPVDHDLPVSLDVRAVIPLKETQLHDPFENLRLTFEPIMLALGNLPSGPGDGLGVIGAALAGNVDPLFAETEYTQNPWPGFSRTAGLNYDLLDESRRLNTPAESALDAQAASEAGEEPPSVILTGIVPQGGIPALDAQVRSELYDGEQSPNDVNKENRQQAEALLPPPAFAGGFENLEPPTEEAPPPPAEGELVPDFPPQPALTPVPGS